MQSPQTSSSSSAIIIQATYWLWPYVIVEEGGTSEVILKSYTIQKKKKKVESVLPSQTMGLSVYIDGQCREPQTLVWQLWDIMPSGTPLSYGTLSTTFRQHRWMHFCHFQLQHAVHSQLKNPPMLEADPIEHFLAQESLTESLSTLYLALLSVQSPKMDRLWDQLHVKNNIFLH